MMIKSANNTQSTQASSFATYTDSVVNLHSNIKNQNIIINQERNLTSDSSDGVREAKRQKTSACAHALSTTSDRDTIAFQQWKTFYKNNMHYSARNLWYRMIHKQSSNKLAMSQRQLKTLKPIDVNFTTRWKMPNTS
ncbi:hypothetical protein MAM1_0167d07080 [Mucor ambiguus]|uniref:Uncharacterized protein n=1 Tax=Mucor ambiguus TaxID=91626 RepID=A0A0C9LVY4_9FUNG|nr:hypothetical protein MAM1_0167d07080 [Mucor ambiguus]